MDRKPYTGMCIEAYASVQEYKVGCMVYTEVQSHVQGVQRHVQYSVSLHTDIGENVLTLKGCVPRIKNRGTRSCTVVHTCVQLHTRVQVLVQNLIKKQLFSTDFIYCYLVTFIEKLVFYHKNKTFWTDEIFSKKKKCEI